MSLVEREVDNCICTPPQTVVSVYFHVPTCVLSRNPFGPQNITWPPGPQGPKSKMAAKNVKMVQIQKFFFLNLVENSISRNIKMRHFSLRPIFWTQEPKIQDGRPLRSSQVVELTFFLLHLESKFLCLFYVFSAREIVWDNFQVPPTTNYPIINVITLIKTSLKVIFPYIGK